MILLSTVIGYGQVHLEPACINSTEKYWVKGLPGSIFIWDVDGGETIGESSNDTVNILWGNKPGSHRIVVSESTASGCSDLTEAIVVVRGPYVELGNEYPEICQGETYPLDVGNNFQQPADITWSDGSKGERYLSNSTEKIWAQVIDGFGCMASDTVSLTVNHLPVVNLGKDTVLCDEGNPLTIHYTQVMKNAQKEFSQAHWQINKTESYDDYIVIEAMRDKTDTLVATMTNIKGCMASDTVRFLACDVKELFKNMSNTILPNSTEGNDKWNIPYMDIFTKAELEIFDRWGRLVYRTERVLEEPWDGTSKGRPLPMDSYYYVLKLNFNDAAPITGTVNLIK
jgi:gliding motility-associated-like protein